MDMTLKAKFIRDWKKYFNGAELPIAFYYTGDGSRAGVLPPPAGHQCIIGVLARVRRGGSLCFEAASVNRGGGKGFTGFAPEPSPGFEYFLSCGIQGGRPHDKWPI